jgi:hypothetical protein
MVISPLCNKYALAVHVTAGTAIHLAHADVRTFPQTQQVEEKVRHHGNWELHEICRMLNV